MVKCAAYLCRSGYAPTKTEKANGTVLQTLSVFSFPKDNELRAEWVSALRRRDTNWDPDHCGICELHFQEDDFYQETRRKSERKRKCLKKGAIPSIFNQSWVLAFIYENKLMILTLLIEHELNWVDNVLPSHRQVITHNTIRQVCYDPLAFRNGR